MNPPIPGLPDVAIAAISTTIYLLIAALCSLGIPRLRRFAGSTRTTLLWGAFGVASLGLALGLPGHLPGSRVLVLNWIAAGLIPFAAVGACGYVACRVPREAGKPSLVLRGSGAFFAGAVLWIIMSSLLVVAWS